MGIYRKTNRMNKRISMILRESIKSVLNEEWTSDGHWHFSPEFKNAKYEGPDLEAMGIVPVGTHGYEYPHTSHSYNPNLDIYQDGEVISSEKIFPDEYVINRKIDEYDKADRRAVYRAIDDFKMDNPDIFNPDNWDGVADEDMPEVFYRYTDKVPLSRLRRAEADELRRNGKQYKEVPSIGVKDPYGNWNQIQTALEYRRMYPDYMDVNV